MKRLSIGKAMALTALVAVDLAWLRGLWAHHDVVFQINRNPGPACGFLLEYGFLGMANILGLTALARSGARSFFTAGLLAMIAYYAVCLRWGDIIIGHPRGPSPFGLTPISWKLAASLKAAGFLPSTAFNCFCYRAIQSAVRVVLLTTPQLLAAVLVSRFTERIAARRAD